MKAILFDFDGTLANTVPALREGLNRTMREMGYPEHTEEDVLQYVNRGAREFVRLALPLSEQKNDGVIDRAFEIYNRHYGDVCCLTPELYPGLFELLQKLRREGFEIGVLSNKQEPMLKKLCEKIVPAGCLSAVQGVEAGKPTKPDAYMTESIRRKLGGIAPSDCLLVGDSDVDLLTARNGGIRHVAVTWGFRNEEFLRRAGAEAFAHTATELYTVIHKILD